MKDLSRRKFLTGAAVVVPAAAVVATLPQLAAQAAPINPDPQRLSAGSGAWPGAEIIVPDRVLESSAPLGEGNEADYTVDFEKQTITLNAPCTGLVLHQSIHRQWRDTDAIRYAYPLMAITPELFTMQDGWKLDGVANLQNASLENDGYGHRVLGCISLGQVFKDENLQWAPGNKHVLGYWHLFSKPGHVNEGITFPSKAETIYIKCDGERKDMGEMCGMGDMSRRTSAPIRFPLFQEYKI